MMNQDVLMQALCDQAREGKLPGFEYDEEMGLTATGDRDVEELTEEDLVE